jgi:hypothetical protein
MGGGGGASKRCLKKKQVVRCNDEQQGTIVSNKVE